MFIRTFDHSDIKLILNVFVLNKAFLLSYVSSCPKNNIIKAINGQYQTIDERSAAYSIILFN